MKPLYKRVLLKISGEALMGAKEFGLDQETVTRLAYEIKAVHDMGVEVCVVVGAGNIFRGLKGAAVGMERANADFMGMLGTVINALAMQDALEKLDLDTRVQSAIPMSQICEPYVRRRAERHLEKGRVVIFAGGTGNPYFTTDTAAALRASEHHCDALLKATSVDGVYSDDPKLVPHATRYAELTHQDVLRQDLRVMDASAVAMARDSGIPILIFSLHEAGAFTQVISGEGRYTRIGDQVA